MFKFLTYPFFIIEAPCTGEVKPLSQSQDEVFRSEALGKGFFIQPAANKLYSPITGTITSIFPTKHAIGIKDKHGLELLIHIGIDTVYLNGTMMENYCKAGDKVHAGEALMDVDFKVIEQQGYCGDVYVLILNSADYEITFLKQEGKVHEGDPIMQCKRLKNEA